MALVFRNTKGSTLTHSEMDNNFAELNNSINALLDSAKVQRFTLDSADTIALIDSAYINARSTDNLDSSEVLSLIDSGYVQARQITDYLDSALARQMIEATYTFLDSALTKDVIDSDYIQSKSLQIQLKHFTVATVPSGKPAGHMIFVTDGNAGEPTLAVKDSANGFYQRISFGGAVSASGGGGF